MESSKSVVKATPSSLAAAYVTGATNSDKTPALGNSPTSPSASASTSPILLQNKESSSSASLKLSTSEELRTQICSNKYCQCIRRDGKMHRVNDLIRVKLKQRLRQAKEAQQAAIEAQARDFLESLDQPLTVAPTKTKTTSSYEHAVETAIRRLDPKIHVKYGAFSRKSRRIQVDWNYVVDNSKANSPTTRPTKCLRLSTAIPQTIQTMSHSKQGSFRRRASELTVASELTTQTAEVVALSASGIAQQQQPKAMHPLTDEEEAAIVSVATATAAATRLSTRSSIPSVRFFAPGGRRHY